MAKKLAKKAPKETKDQLIKRLRLEVESLEEALAGLEGDYDASEEKAEEFAVEAGEANAAASLMEEKYLSARAEIDSLLLQRLVLLAALALSAFSVVMVLFF